MNTPNFSDIYTLYFEDVYKYLLALCHDEELAEELAQDTFFKAMKSYENFRGDCKITTWLCQIAKHSFFLYEKHRKRNIDLNSVENEIVDTNSIEILLGQREQAFGIHIQQLARQRKVLYRQKREPERAAREEKIKSLTQQMKALRHEVYICSDIETDAAEVQEKLRQAELAAQEERNEVKQDEQRRRSSRSDGAGSLTGYRSSH